MTGAELMMNVTERLPVPPGLDAVKTTTAPPLPEGTGASDAGRLRRTLPAWQRCSLVEQTPHFLASMQLEDALSVGDPTGVEMSGSSVATNDSWSPAAGLVWLNDSSVSYLVAGTLQGCVCVWDVSRAVVSEGQKAATQTTALSLSSHSPPLNVGDGSSSIGDQTKSQPPSASVSSVPALRVVE